MLESSQAPKEGTGMSQRPGDTEGQVGGRWERNIVLFCLLIP